MPIYEFITPSDPITFVAPDDCIARYCTILLGNGKAFCKNERDETLDNTCFLFASEKSIEASFHAALGGVNPKAFLNARRADIVAAFASFAYGSREARCQYDDAVAAITDPAKLAEFKAQHEDRQRTSMSKWVAYAWKLSKELSLSPLHPAEAAAGAPMPGAQ